MHVQVHVAQDPLFVSKNSSAETVVRGILDLELAKPTRVTSIEVSVIATWYTSWPAGIPPTYQDHSEESVETIVADLLYSDKLNMVLKSSTGSGSQPASPSGSGSNTPSRRQSKFTSISTLLRDSLVANSNNAQQGVELPAASYTCPFLFSLPKDAPPTINLPHGSRTYQLKAHIHRAGLLVPSVTRSVPFTVVLLSEHEQSFVNTSHEDKWEDSLLYAWRVGRNPAFVLGETIPLELTLVPLEKVFVHKITVALQQQATYRAREGNMVDREVRSFELMSLKQPHISTPLLPILPNAPANTLALLTETYPSSSSSVSASTSRRQPDLEYSAQLQRLEGPWNLSFDIPVPPKNSTGLHFTFDERPNSPIEVDHTLSIEILVSIPSIAEGNRPSGKQRDGPLIVDGKLSAGELQTITITAPIHLLSEHASAESTSLPSYFDILDPHPSDPYHFLLRNGLYSASSTSSASLSTTTSPGDGSGSANHSSTILPPRFDPNDAAASPTASMSRVAMAPSAGELSGKYPNADSKTLEQLRRFTQLIGGRVSVDGEMPPMYHPGAGPSSKKTPA